MSSLVVFVKRTLLLFSFSLTAALRHVCLLKPFSNTIEKSFHYITHLQFNKNIECAQHPAIEDKAQRIALAASIIIVDAMVLVYVSAVSLN